MSTQNTVRVMANMRGVYAITPDCLEDDHLLDISEEIIDAGARVIQYRNKLAVASQRETQARALQKLCAQRGVYFIVNDDVMLALAVNASGVHLGRDDGDLAVVRAGVPQDFLIGVSCYNDPARANAALTFADYVAFGAFFPSLTKPDAVHASLDCLTWRLREPRPAVAAIGGITLARVPELLAAGADLVCGVSDLFMASSPYYRTKAWVRVFKDFEYDNVTQSGAV